MTSSENEIDQVCEPIKYSLCQWLCMNFKGSRSCVRRWELAMFRIPWFLLGIFSVALAANAQDQKEAFSYGKHPDKPQQFLCELQDAIFTSPERWYPYSASGRNAVCKLGPAEEAGERVLRFSRVLNVEIEKRELIDADALAKEWEKNLGGKIQTEVLAFDGVKGVLIRMPASKVHDTRPVEVVVFVREGIAYTISGGCKEQGDLTKLSEGLKEIAKSWKWKEKKK